MHLPQVGSFTNLNKLTLWKPQYYKYFVVLDNDSVEVSEWEFKTIPEDCWCNWLGKKCPFPHPGREFQNTFLV
jgi:hypothetical protein